MTTPKQISFENYGNTMTVNGFNEEYEMTFVIKTHLASTLYSLTFEEAKELKKFLSEQIKSNNE